MLTLFYVGIFFSLVLMACGIVATGFLGWRYFSKRTVSDQAAGTFLISLVVGIVVFLCSQIFFPTGLLRWGVVWLSLLCVAIPMIICCIIDIHNGYETGAKFRWWIHLLFLISVTAIPFGRFGGDYLDSASLRYQYREGVVKVIDKIIFETEWEKVYEYVETSNGEGSVPTGKQQVVKAVLVTTDGIRIPISRVVNGVDYNAIYPHGDTITVYKNKLIRPRSYFMNSH